MNKEIWKLIGEWPYFLGNGLLGVSVVFLPDYLLILFLLKHRDVRVF